MASEITYAEVKFKNESNSSGTYSDSATDKVWSCCPKDWKPFSSHCYLISNDSASWRESEEKCSSMGAHLMVVHSQEEQDFITKILDPKANYYIGLSDPGHRQWRWVDQTPYNESATFWHPGEPNSDHEQCVIVNHRYSGWGWNDIPCSVKQKSVCQMKKIYL
ncbi:C-type lectin domain family 4 member A-like isoform X2 [Peromyscus eremicus]|uniref:C-type lectin domain family 4 member A-like isoform X2 n=1 Tax=Peromyscus eremicus TaxID=42410 RepID=UPI0027DD0C41|nr:C-type lectin domain family 4 member A-like isoform X2 [Peromyscus eremicus]